MPIPTTVTPANARALTTPARIKAELGDVGRTTSQLAIRISQATGILERYCGRVFARETVVERWYATQVRECYLERVPVASIASVTVGSIANPNTIDPAQYAILDAQAGRVRFDLFDIGLPPDLRLSEMAYGYSGAVTDPGGGRIYGYRQPLEQAVTVTYTGGWVTPAWTDGSTPDLPADLEEACILLVRAMIHRSDRDGDLASIRLGDASFAYQRATGGGGSANLALTEEIQAMVGPYRRVVL